MMLSSSTDDGSDDDSDFFDTTSFADDETSRKPKKMISNASSKMSETNDSWTNLRQNSTRDLQNTQDMLSSLDLSRDFTNTRRKKNSGSSSGETKRSTGRMGRMLSSEDDESEEEMHTCSDDDDEEENETKRNTTASKPLPPAPKRFQARHAGPIKPKSTNSSSSSSSSSPPRVKLKKVSSLVPPSKQPPPRPQRLKPLDTSPPLRAASAKKRLSRSPPGRGKKKRPERLKALPKVPKLDTRRRKRTSPKQLRSVEDFAKNFRTSASQRSLNLKIEISDSNAEPPKKKRPNLRIEVSDSNLSTPPSSPDNDNDGGIRSNLKGALADLIEEDESGNVSSSTASSSNTTSNNKHGLMKKNSGRRKKTRKRNMVGAHDPAAQSYDFSASGAFAMAGFRLKESGITHVPGQQMMIRPEQIKRDLLKLSTLGRGASGSVYKSVHVPTLRLCAVKEIPVYETEKRKQMIRELKALYANLVPIDEKGGGSKKESSSPCPFVVSFFDAFISPNDGNVSIVMEHMDGGSLQDIVDTGGCAAESVLSNISYRVLKGLAFIHERHQIHRDIKPSNLLINHWGEVKVSDFGIVRELDDSLAQAKTFCGTLSYMSPERISGQEYSYDSDIWSFGLSIMTCALGKFPLPASGGYWSLLHKLRDEPPPELPESEFSDVFRDFMKQCLVKDPKKRPSAKKLLKHPFVRDCVVPKIDYESNCSGEGSNTARNELNEICDKVLKQLYGYFSSDSDLSVSQRLKAPVHVDESKKGEDEEDDDKYEIPPLDEQRMRLLARQLGLDPRVVFNKFERKRREMNQYMQQQLDMSRRSLMSLDSTV